MLLCNNVVKFSYRFLPIMFFPLLAQSGTRKMRLAFFLIAEFKMADKIQNGRQNLKWPPKSHEKVLSFQVIVVLISVICLN